MATSTRIQWTDHTFNPWIGCAKIAPGCSHCYAEAMMDHRWGRARWGEDGTRERTAPANWAHVRRWDREAWPTLGRNARVFCASLADIAEDRPELEPIRTDLVELIASTRHLDWLLLTKRLDNLRRLYPPDLLAACWVGVSCSTQEDLDREVPKLLATPTRVRFVSLEPILELVEVPKGPDWVIVGGESGPQARPCAIEWVHSVVGQTKANGAAVFVKQLGANPTSGPLRRHPAPCGRWKLDHKGGHRGEWPTWFDGPREFPQPHRPGETRG